MHGINVSKLAFSILAAREADRLLAELAEDAEAVRVDVLLDMLDHDTAVIEDAACRLLALDSEARAEVLSDLQPHLTPEEFFSFVYNARELAYNAREAEQENADYDGGAAMD